MNSDGLRGLIVERGPGGRDPDCGICLTSIEASDSSTTHSTCQNRFHRDCFDNWAIRSYIDSASTTCPMCRVRLSSLVLGNGTLLQGVAIPCPSFSWWDYELQFPDDEGTNWGRTYPSPLLIHRLTDPRHRLSGWQWLNDFLLRVARVGAGEPFFDESRGAVFRAYWGMLKMGLELPKVPIKIELQDGEIVTDLEIIDREGRRRPRPAIIDLYMSYPRYAHTWFAQRTRFSAYMAVVDPVEASNFVEEFEIRVFEVIKVIKDRRDQRLEQRFPPKVFRQQDIRQFFTGPQNSQADIAPTRNQRRRRRRRERGPEAPWQ